MQIHLCDGVLTQNVGFLLLFPKISKEKQNVKPAKLFYARNATENIIRAHVDQSLKMKSTNGKIMKTFKHAPFARQ
jgi:hypothetical protein